MNFLDNGEYYLIGYIPGILKKFEQLYEAISSMDSFRFYASSLLMIYDGEKSDDVNIKMVDFASCVSNADVLFSTKPCPVNYPPTKKGADSGYLLGLRTLMSCFKEIYKDLKDEVAPGSAHVFIKSLSNTRRMNVLMGLLAV